MRRPAGSSSSLQQQQQQQSVAAAAAAAGSSRDTFLYSSAPAVTVQSSRMDSCLTSLCCFCLGRSLGDLSPRISRRDGRRSRICRLAGMAGHPPVILLAVLGAVRLPATAAALFCSLSNRYITSLHLSRLVSLSLSLYSLSFFRPSLCSFTAPALPPSGKKGWPLRMASSASH